MPLEIWCAPNFLGGRKIPLTELEGNITTYGGLRAFIAEKMHPVAGHFFDPRWIDILLRETKQGETSRPVDGDLIDPTRGIVLVKFSSADRMAQAEREDKAFFEQMIRDRKWDEPAVEPGRAEQPLGSDEPEEDLRPPSSFRF
jgi:hypothetical protein